MTAKRFLIVTLFLIFAGSLIFAGGTSQQPSAGGTAKKTLKMIGGGQFGSTGPDGTIDAVTGRAIAGYRVVVDEWNRLHPDVTLEIETNPEPNWQAALQTGVMAGGVDILIHGASMVDLVVPLNDRVAADPAWAAKRVSYSVRRNPALGSLDNFYITGIPVTVNAMVVLLNKDILAHYNVKLPEENWTWDDLINIAKTCTGTDPVTGTKTYGFQFHGSNQNGELRKNFSLVGYGIGANPTIQYAVTAKDSKVNYNDANAMRIWNILGELAKYTSPADREGIDVSTPALNFDVALYFNENAVGLYNQLKDVGALDKYYVQSLPTVNAGELRGDITPFIGDSNLSICKISAQQDLAWEWIKFATTNEVAINYYMQAGTGAMVNHRDYAGNLNKLVDQGWVNVMNRAIAKIPGNYSPSTGLYQNNVNFGNLDTVIGESVRMLMMGSGTTTQAANLVQQAVNDYTSSLR
jgi:ABC-type glycerol-3-phosphate transport system substrate-binding protein